MQRLLPPIVLSLVCAPVFAQQFGAPAFEVPMVVLHSNQDAMSELLDHDGTGSTEALSFKISVGPTSSTVVGKIRRISGSAYWQNWTPVVAYVPTMGTMVPVSDVGQIGVPDAAQEAVFAVSHTVWVIANFTLIDTWTSGNLVLDVAVGDFDDDGDGDVAVLSELPNGDRTLQLRLWAGGTFQSSPAHVLPQNAGSHLFATDTNGDVIPEAVVIGQSMQSTAWTPSGWSAVQDLVVGVASPMPTVGDFDNDGDVDIVVFGHTDYVVLRRVGPLSFVVEPPVTGGPATHLYDLDGDGDLDGACCSGGGSPATALLNPMTYHVSINDNGTFLPAYKMHGVGGYHLAGVTDVDGNGFLDLVAGRTTYYSQQSLAIPPAASLMTAGPQPLALFDADGDGDVDQLGDTLAWQRNRGDGTFDAASLVLLTPPPLGVNYQAPVVTGDFDGDGDDDLIVNVHDSSGAIGTRLLLQRGDAYADGGVPLPSGMTLSPAGGGDLVNLVCADLDQDQDLDLVLNAPAPAIASTLLYNNGTGQFTATPLPNFTVKAAADFTNDGLVDLLVCDGRLLMRRGMISGGFQATENLTLTGFPHLHHANASDPHGEPVLVADWNNDGILDLIARENYPSATPTAYNAILISSGGGTPPFSFDYLPTWATGTASALPTRYAAADIDADGNLDCIVGNAGYGGDDSVVILFGTGNAQLFDTTKTQNLMLPFGPFADVDADGDADALRNNVVPNNSVAAPAAGQRVQWSAGSPGAGGRTPLLGIGGVVATGHTIEVRAAALQGQTFGLLALDTTTWNVPLFGGTSYVDPTVSVGWAANGAAALAGDGNASLILPLSSNLAGLTFHLQAAFLDTAVGISLSNPVTITIGQ